jgi:hypothetical protein
MLLHVCSTLAHILADNKEVDIGGVYRIKVRQLVQTLAAGMDTTIKHDRLVLVRDDVARSTNFLTRPKRSNRKQILFRDGEAAPTGPFLPHFLEIMSSFTKNHIHSLWVHVCLSCTTDFAAALIIYVGQLVQAVEASTNLHNANRKKLDKTAACQNKTGCDKRFAIFSKWLYIGSRQKTRKDSLLTQFRLQFPKAYQPHLGLQCGRKVMYTIDA